MTCDQVPAVPPLTRLTSLDVSQSLSTLLGGTAILPVAGSDRRADPSRATSANWLFALADEERALAPAVAEAFVAQCAAEQCRDAWIRELGQRFYRRPLSDGEVSGLGAVFSGVAAMNGDVGGAAAVIDALSLSPFFVFRVEVGELGASGDDVALTAYEIASRLSYFAWRSTPSDELLAGASTGALSDPDVIEKTWREMAADPRGQAGLARQGREWFGIDGELEAAVQRGLSLDLAGDMIEQSELFFAWLFSAGDHRLETLLTTPHSLLNGALAAQLGVAGVSGDFQDVELDPTRFSGVLTLGAFLVTYPHSPQRGRAVRERVLCQPIPPPPANVDTALPDYSREQVEAAATEPSCAACHSLMNPIGFGLGAFDELAAPTAEQDLSGELSNVEVDVTTFNGAHELGQVLADTAEAAGCAAVTFTSYALDYPATLVPGDSSLAACALDAFEKHDRDLLELGAAIVSSDVFRRRQRAWTAVPEISTTSTRAVDHALEEAEALRSLLLNPEDRMPLELYLEALRELEIRDTQ